MRKTFFKIHSYLALVALIPLLIVSITGSILVFKVEIDQWLMPKVAALPYAQSEKEVPERLNHNILQQHIEGEFPDYILGAWELFNDGHEADRVYLVKKGTDDWFKIYFDPFANKVLSEPVNFSHYITDFLLQLHYTFMLNGIGGEHAQWGTVLGLIAAVILTLLGITGLVIHRKFWLKLFDLRIRASLRVFSGDFHRLVGAWSSPIIFILGITGIYFNAVAIYHELFEHPSEEHYEPTEKLYDSSIDFQQLLNDSRVQLDTFTPTYLLYPYEPEVNITVFGHQQRANPFASNYSSTVTYDRTNGELLNAFDGRDASAVVKTTDSFRELHFGSFGGLGSKIVWCVVGLSPVLLGGTGLYIWVFRNRKKKQKGGAH